MVFKIILLKKQKNIKFITLKGCYFLKSATILGLSVFTSVNFHLHTFVVGRIKNEY